MAIVQYKNFSYLKGPAGDQGLKGDKGDRGPKGDQGPVGLTGPQGPRGLSDFTGGTLTSPLILYGNPTSALEAVTRQYVDSAIDSIPDPIYSTDDVAEGATNKYYTDSRARSAISATGAISYNSATGVISLVDNGDYATQADIDIAITNLIGSAPELLNTLNELANALGDDANFVVNIANNLESKLNISDFTNTVDAWFSTRSTSNLVEGNRLYYTDARARAAISVIGSGSYDSSTGVITVTGGVTSVNSKSGAVTLTTSDIDENNNLYFTDARAQNAISVTGSLTYSNGIISYTTPETIASLSNHTTTDLVEGANLYYTTARANTDFDLRLATKSTTNLVEGANLYFTTERVDDRLDDLIVAGKGLNKVYDDAGNLLNISVDFSEFNIDDITEGAVNQYFNNKTTTNLVEGTNLYFTDARAIAANKTIIDNAIAEVSSNLTSEVNRATGAENILTINLAGEVTRATSAEATLTNNLLNEITRAGLAETALSNSIASEVTARSAGDLTNANAITAETNRATGVENTIAGNLTAEVNRATIAENSIANDLSTEVNRATNAESVLTTNLTTEVIRATNAENAEATARANAISAEEQARMAGDTANANAIATETSNRIAGDTANANAIANEVVRATTAESQLQSNLDNEAIARNQADIDIGQRITDLTTDDIAEGTNLYYTTARANTDFDIRLATKTTNDLTEGDNLYYTDARARNSISVEGTLYYDAVSGVISTFSSNVPTEVKLGSSAGLANQGFSAIAIGTGSGNDNQGAYSIAIGAFAGRTNQAPNSIILSAVTPGAGWDNPGEDWDELSWDDIDDAVTADTAGFFVKPVRNVNTTNPIYYNSITGEISYGEFPDFALTSYVDAADDQLQSNLDAETVARIADDTVLTNNLAAEVTRATSAENAEATARIASDNNLQNQIDFIVSNINPEALDSLTEIVTAFQNADNTINGAITLLGSTLQSNINAEAASRIAADTILTNNLSSEVTRATNAESAEATTRAASDETINQRIDDLTTANIREVDNLYYTEARVDDNFRTKTTSALLEGNNLYYTTARANADFDARLAIKSTTNLGEGTNLYYTEARVDDNFRTKTTSALLEGNNLYYTDARARAAISAGNGLNYNAATGEISIGQDVGTQADVTFNDVIVTGNLTVQGTTTNVNSTTVDIADLNLTLAKGSANASQANGAGLTIDGADATITYTSSNDSWNINKPLNVAGTVTLSSDPVTGSDAVTKNYVDNAINSIPDPIGDDPTFNSVTVNGDITSSNQVVTKNYVDTQISSTLAATHSGNYTFTQSVPSNVWMINHNLGARFVDIEIIDADGTAYDGRFDYPSISFEDPDNAVITFTEPMAGWAVVSHGVAVIGDVTELANVAVSGSYLDLRDAPPIATRTGTHTHTQDAAEIQWTIHHGLGTRFVDVEIIDENGVLFDGRFDYPTITFVDADNLTVTFTDAQSGWAVISHGVTVMKNLSELAHVAVSGSYLDLRNTPELFSGSYNDLTNKPTNYLSVTGGTMTGSLILNSNPSNNLEAATKQYVDNATSSIVTSYNDLTDVPSIPTDINDLTDNYNLLDSVGNGASTWSDITFDGGTDYTDIDNDNYSHSEVILEAENLDIPVIVHVPETSSSIGIPGQIAYDSNYIYACVAENTWKRSPLTSW